MMKLQEAYNALKESSVSRDEVDKLQETIVQLKKSLAVEKRGMSYSKVSDLLEGAKTDDEIESRLNSLSSVSRRQKSRVLVESVQTKESSKSEPKRLTRLASIVSKV